MQKTAALLRFDLKLINCEKFIRALNNIACIPLPSAILILTDKLIIVIRRALIRSLLQSDQFIVFIVHVN